MLKCLALIGMTNIRTNKKIQMIRKTLDLKQIEIAYRRTEMIFDLLVVPRLLPNRKNSSLNQPCLKTTPTISPDTGTLYMGANFP